MLNCGRQAVIGGDSPLLLYHSFPVFAIAKEDFSGEGNYFMKEASEKGPTAPEFPAGFLNELIKCEQVLKFIQKPLTVGEVDCRKARRRGLSHTNLCPLSQLTLTAPPKWQCRQLNVDNIAVIYFAIGEM